MKNTVYHYTTFKSFKNIIEKKCVYLNCSKHLNDDSELRVFIKDVYNLLFNDKTINHHQQSLHQFFKDFETENGNFINKLPDVALSSAKEPHFFSLSTPKDCDKAIQWLSYGNGGKGMLIYLSKKYLTNLCNKISEDIGNQDVLFDEVCYISTKKYQNRIRKMSEIIKKAVFGESADNGDVWRDAFKKLLMLSHFAKCDEFSFEKEIRLSFMCFLDNLPKTNYLKYKSKGNTYSNFY